jgi:Kef-type K+ transport system membrane component KefB
VFGAFLAGIIIGNIKNRKFQRVKLYIKKFSFAFFIPIYFSIVGIKIDLIHHFDLLFFIEFLAFTTCFEIIGTYLAMKILKLDNLSSMNFAIAMNAKGGPGIVLATIAFDMGIINETFFVSLVLTAILTSLLAGSWFSQILSRGKPLMKDKY